VGLNYAPERTGIAPYTTGMVEGLRAGGHDVRVVTTYSHYPQWTLPSPERRRTQRAADTRTRRVRHYVPAEPSGLRRLAAELSFGLRAVTSRWHRPDVVICVSPALFSSALVALRARLTSPARRPALGLVVQDLYSRGLAETSDSGRRLGSLMSLIEQRILASFDGVSVIHTRFRRVLESQFGIPDEKVAVVRNWTHITPPGGVDVAGFRSRMGWRDNECVVLHAGAMGVKQALGNVVDAARLADARDADVRFVLLGGGSQRESLVASANGVDRLQFLDSLDDDDFGRALQAADVLLVNEKPGLVEMAVPSKLTSYFVSAKPVVAATEPTSATAEELESAGAGIRVPPGDPDALLTAALEIRADSRYPTFGPAGRRYAETVLAAQKAFDDYGAWVDTLVERSGRRPR
jgi:glycosyltransferase involved in cell wall biosynthesis